MSNNSRRRPDGASAHPQDRSSLGLRNVGWTGGEGFDVEKAAEGDSGFVRLQQFAVEHLVG